MSNNQEEMINKIIEESSAKIKDYTKIIEDCEKTIKVCDNIKKYSVDPKVIKKVKYNAIIAKNALENADVAGPNDRVVAEQNIRDCNVNLMESKSNFEQLEKDIKKITSDVLVGDINRLDGIIARNSHSCDTAIEYANSVIKGEINKELENKFNMEMNDGIKGYGSFQNEVNEEENIELNDKVVGEEDFEPNVEIDFGALGQELDEAVNSNEEEEVQVNLDDIDNVDDITAEITPVETPEVDDLSNTIETTSLFTEDAPLEEEEEQPLTMENNDSELIKVVDIEPVVSQDLEEEQEEVKTRGRKAA